MIKTTQEHFEYFKYICLQWFKVFELGDWEIYFKHGDTDGNLAFIKFDLQAHLIACHFCDEWNETLKPFTREEIFKSAKHEMLHNLLAMMSSLAAARYVTHDQLESVEEALVHKLNRLIPDSLIEDELEIDLVLNGKGGDEKIGSGD